MFYNIAAKRVAWPCSAFYHPYQTSPATIRLLTGLNDGGKTHNIAFQLVLQQCCITSSIACFFRPFLPKLYKRTKTPRKITLKSANIQRTDLYLVSLKLSKSTFQEKKEIYGAPMKPSELFCFKDTIILRRYYFFLAASNRISRGQMRQPYTYDANDVNESTRRLVEDGKGTGLTNMHTARRFSVLYHVFARKQCTALKGCRLPPSSLEKTRGCSLAIIGKAYERKVKRGNILQNSHQRMNKSINK